MKQIVLVLSLIITCPAIAQKIPLEVFAGNDKVSFDLLLFKYLKNKKGENSPWLFINRDRIVMDYRMTSTTFLPQFAITNAFAYTPKSLKGFAPVGGAQIKNSGIIPKVGIFYSRAAKNWNGFTYLLVYPQKEAALEYALVFRYLPAITKKVKLFSQLEYASVYPTYTNGNILYIQRIRTGIKLNAWQFGAATDLQETGNTNFKPTATVGGFLRLELD